MLHKIDSTCLLYEQTLYYIKIAGFVFYILQLILEVAINFFPKIWLTPQTFRYVLWQFSDHSVIQSPFFIYCMLQNVDVWQTWKENRCGSGKKSTHQRITIKYWRNILEPKQLLLILAEEKKKLKRLEKDKYVTSIFKKEKLRSYRLVSLTFIPWKLLEWTINQSF